ncbi:hypothetical protein AB1E22_06810 [Buttiauxella gaviniae]|uniref:Uncharacterized protein n=1 Tax=Buttiauxella gaviniae TaxID=82990 RepID=A0ABV3NSE3_9ENTR
MLITSLMNKKLKLVLLILLQITSISTIASEDYSTLVEGNKLFVLTHDNKKLSIPLVEDADDWSIVDNLNKIDGYTYLAIFYNKHSNLEKPEGFCGAGFELWLYIYKIYDHKVDVIGKVLAGSCKKSFSMASLESGFSNDDKDYSSFKWNKSGFSIEWFLKKDERGSSISKTFYSINGLEVYSE